MKYVLFGIGLLSLVGCGDSDESEIVSPPSANGSDSDIVDGEVNSVQLKATAVITDGYKQITVTPDSDLELTLKSGEPFVLNSSGSTPEKLIIQGKLTITTN
ncbi:hypothetical protein [Psychromonas sp.]|uniref:hypothetical protein n=1 Tax=Psychromonas sp. TaxID=1884585 RepID=UPI00356583F4